jgi:hypothetical protein
VRLLTRESCSFRESLLFAAVSLGLAAIVYGPHVARGGFILDDWGFAAEADLWGGQHGFFSLVERLRSDPDVLMGVNGRPVAALYFAATHTVFGGETGLHIALAVALAALVSTLFYVLLRVLGMERLHAALISLLVLVFPAADAARLWLAATTSLAGLAFYFAGLLLALRGLRLSGRAAVLFHAGALACYALSLMVYEVTAAAIAVSVLVYRLRAPWRPSVYRWIADVALVGVAALYLRSTTGKETLSLTEMPDRARDIQGQARSLLGALGLQDGERRLPVPIVAAVLVAALLVWWLSGRRGEDRKSLGRWLSTALVGIVAIGIGYAPYVAVDDPQLEPLVPGLGNRVNIAPAFGFVLLIYATAMLLGLLIVRAAALVRPVSTRLAVGFTVLAALAIGVLWVVEVNDDRRAYGRAYALEREAIDVLREGTRPPPGTTVFTFGQPGEVAPFVPAFSRHWDLTGAVRLVWRDQTLRGIPGPSISRDRPGIGSRWGIACTTRGVQPLGIGWSSANVSPYGTTLFVQVPERRRLLVESREDCRRALVWVEPTLTRPYRESADPIASS